MKKAATPELPAPQGGMKTGFVLAVVFTVLYSTTRTRLFSYDGLCYALDVEFGGWSNVFHPNHLLYSFLNRLFYLLFSFKGQAIRAIALMQGINAVVGGITVGFFYVILEREFGWRRALWGAVALGFCHSFWTEAVDPGCYAWAALASCFLVGLLLHAEEWGPFAAGVAHGVTILFHQMFILLVPAFVLKLKLKKSPAYLGGVALVVVSAYALIAGVFHGGSLGEGLYWALGPGLPPSDTPILSSYWWNFNLGRDTLSAWQQLVHSILAPGSASDASATAVGYLVVGGVMLFLVLSSRRYFKTRNIAGDTLAALWVWIIAMNLFQFFFWPAIHYRLLFIPPLIYMALALTRGYQNRQLYVVASAAVLGLGLFNYDAAIGPQSRASNNPNLLRTWWVGHLLQPNDVFLFSGSGAGSIINVYVPYFAPQVRGRSLGGYFFDHHGDISELQRMVSQALHAHQRVYVESALFDPKNQAQWDYLGKLPPGTFHQWLSTLHIRKELIGQGVYQLYEVS